MVVIMVALDHIMEEAAAVEEGIHKDIPHLTITTITTSGTLMHTKMDRQDPLARPEDTSHLQVVLPDETIQ